jgi:hypothetical protein
MERVTLRESQLSRKMILPLRMRCAEFGIADAPAHKRVSGGYIGGVTPVPIPNTEVKPSRADGTPRETAWESRSLPDFFNEQKAGGGCKTAAGTFWSEIRDRTPTLAYFPPRLLR